MEGIQLGFSLLLMIACIVIFFRFIRVISNKLFQEFFSNLTKKTVQVYHAVSRNR
ncbi:hypothetical protein BleG1_1868 [Shouchella lehensis G1]|uniref:Uncharacterized protein n=1 Tax=Shouchella lehensis G1 TaxID=1246626 RepID=A0A060LT76_9BACI|nr:hypothetical protein BleG1_1868 [Shouchella lehensis G1]